METSMEGAVFVQTNAAHNEVIAYTRDAAGMLTSAGTFATGGAGNGEAHLPSQGSVTLTRDRRHLLVTNVASNDVSVFAVNGGMLELTKTVPVGAAPRSVAEHDGLVFVLATGDATIQGFRLVDGDLVPLDGAMRALSTPDGAQVGFTPDGRALIATERGGDKLSAFAVGMDGMLGDAAHDRLARRHAVRVRDLAERDARRDRGVPRREGRSRGVELPGGRRHDHAGHREHRQRSQRDLLGRDLQRRPVRVHDELRRRRRVALRDRHGRRAHPRGRDRRRSPRTAARASATRICPTTVGSCTRSTPTRARSSAWSVDEQGHLSMAGSWGGVPTTVAGLAAV